MSEMSQPMQVLTSSEHVEWYTPKKYIDMVKEVMGDIDLDPASNEVANSWIKAEVYFDEGKIGGLSLPWHGRVFCNPPYGKTGGKSNQGIWMHKMELEYIAGRMMEGIGLVYSTHGYSWYEDMWTRYPVCLVRERIKFWTLAEDGVVVEGDMAKKGSTFIYFGEFVGRFEKVFSRIGRVILP